MEETLTNDRKRTKRYVENVTVNTEIIYTNIFVAVSNHDFLVNAEDMPSWEPVGPASAH
jgi:hypothetical protein